MSRASDSTDSRVGFREPLASMMLSENPAAAAREPCDGSGDLGCDLGPSVAEIAAGAYQNQRGLLLDVIERDSSVCD